MVSALVWVHNTEVCIVRQMLNNQALNENCKETSLMDFLWNRNDGHEQ